MGRTASLLECLLDGDKVCGMGETVGMSDVLAQVGNLGRKV